MARKCGKKRDRMDAWVTVRNLSLGWHDKRGGRAVTICFYDKDGSYVGELGVSAATPYWQGNKSETWTEIPTGDLEDRFEEYY